MLALLGYIDPGVGSALIQAAIAGIVGFFYGMKVYGKKIKAFFSKEKKNTAE